MILDLGWPRGNPFELTTDQNSRPIRFNDRIVDSHAYAAHTGAIVRRYDRPNREVSAATTGGGTFCFKPATSSALAPSCNQAKNVPPPVVAALTTLFGRSYRRTIAPV